LGWGGWGGGRFEMECRRKDELEGVMGFSVDMGMDVLVECKPLCWMSVCCTLVSRW
jgi:hypothetical protein